MPCLHLLKGYRSRTVNPSGKRSIVFNPSEGFKDMPVDVPCGQCIECRLDRSREWAIRCVHEASLHEANSFVTLTYNDEHLPKDKSLVKAHMQKFFKRLRWKFAEKHNNDLGIEQKNIRYYYCGEYGEKNDRPHYHACLFNCHFPDKTLWRTINGNRLYLSKTLSELWPFGFSTIGDVTFESAAYVARYITKKVTGKPALYHYTDFDSKGEIRSERLPEYTNMSKRPAIAKEWYAKFKADVYPYDFVVINEKKLKPPRYYDKLYDHHEPGEMAKTKGKRKEQAKKHAPNNTPDRIEIREECKLEKFSRLKRSYESYDT